MGRGQELDDDKEAILSNNEKSKDFPFFWIISLVLVIIGLPMFIYGLATPDYLYDKVIGQNHGSCWERKFGLWTECNKDCTDPQNDWDCQTWGTGHVPVDNMTATCLQVSGLVLAVFGLVCFANRFTRWREQALLGVAIFYFSAAITSLIGSIYLVVHQGNVLNTLVNGMPEGTTIDSHVGLSFRLNTAGASLFIVAGLTSIMGYVKTFRANVSGGISDMRINFN